MNPDHATDQTLVQAPAREDDAGFLRVSAVHLPDWLATHPNALVLDARDADHHGHSHLVGARRLDGRNHEPLLLRVAKHRPVLIYCHRGHASQTYASMFRDFGFVLVADVVGGWQALDPGARLEGPQTPLSLWLSAEGFDPQRPDAPARHGNTPLMHAAWRGAHAVVAELLALGVPLDAVNGDGNNALWLACVHGDAPLIRTLAQAGVPVNHLNLTGATALMYAASSGKAAVASALLALGADAHLQSQDGFNAQDMAATLECLQLLRAATRRVA